MQTSEIELAEDVVERRWMDVQDSIRTKRPYTLAPWQPLPGEPRLAQLAFYSYRDSRQRDLAQTASTMAMKYMDVRDLAKLYEWQQRAEMYDEWVERQGDDARAELIAKTTYDTAAAFARLPALASSAFELVESAVNEKLKAQADRVRSGRAFSEDDETTKPISITQATRIAETVRALLDASTRFLGVKVQVDVTHRGVIDHTHAMTDTDAIGFLQGLSDAGFDVGPVEARAIEVSSGHS